MRAILSTVLVTSFVVLAGCGDSGAPAAASASSPPAASTPPKASAAPAASTVAPAPQPSASAAPRSDCPKDSSGPGTIDQPCAAKGGARLMEAKWTGKIDDEKGPWFAVTNKSTSPVLYGKIVVYFYDKAGKQLEVKDAGGKALPYVVCAGANLFSGVMKPGEKATMTFSCVKKAIVPEGATVIEGELLTVGVADADGKKNEYYWSNKDLAPDVRPKGGVK